MRTIKAIQDQLAELEKAQRDGTGNLSKVRREFIVVLRELVAATNAVIDSERAGQQERKPPSFKRSINAL
jgi:hypothetical protein